MHITIKIDPYSRGILLLILGCLVWLCLDKTTSTAVLADEGRDPPKDKAVKVGELIAARSFVVVDQNGNIRAALSADGRGPNLTFLDSKGNEIVYLGNDELSFTIEGESLFSLLLSKSGSRMQLRDFDKKVHASLLVGHGGNASFSLDGVKERGVSFSNTTDGTTRLSLKGATPQERITLSTTPDGWSSLSLGDSAKAGIRASASSGVSGLVVQDEKHSHAVIVGSNFEAPDNEQNSWLRIIDQHGKNRWKAP